MKRLIPCLAVTLGVLASPAPARPDPGPQGMPGVGDPGFRPIEGSMAIRLPRAPRPPAPAAAPSPPAAPPAVPTPAVAPLPSRALQVVPSGWFGFGLNCEGCGIRRTEGMPVWSFDEFPEIYFVDSDGPAARAGLQRGDVLTHIDGLSLLSDQGGRRFGAVRPGQRVRWTYRRGAATRGATAVAGTRPDGSNASRASLLALDSSLQSLKLMKNLTSERTQRQLEEMKRRLERLSGQEELRAAQAQAQRLRYSGTVGNSDLIVRGLGSVIVSQDEKTGEVVITTRDATIRIRPERAVRTQR